MAVLDSPKDVEAFLQDAEVFGIGVEVLPLPTGDPEAPEDLQIKRIQARLAALEPGWIICTGSSLNQTWRKPGILRMISPGQGQTRDGVVDLAIEGGLTPSDRVEGPGQFSVRGSLLDAWWPGSDWPVRFDYFGNELESIYEFDPTSQRRKLKLSCISVPGKPEGEEIPWIDMLPADWPKVDFTIGERVLPGPCHRGLSFGEPAWPTGTLDVFQSRFADRIHELSRSDRYEKIHLYFDTQEGLEHFRHQGMPDDGRFILGLGRLSESIRLGRTVFMNARSLYGRGGVRRSTPDPEPLLLTDLKPGDPVVHVMHGIARFKSMRLLERDGVSSEFMELEFANRVSLYVPATQMDQVQRYVGAGKAKPRLSILGGKRWEQQKSKVAEALEEMAKELLEVQALRRASPGISFPPHGDLEEAFEAAFPHEETADQLAAMGDLETDMTSARPMDRLLCGDVGFGKTELAMRAAFKAVCGGRQVAVLAPTTVLAEQHLRVFRERFNDFPARIEVLSRLVKSAAARATIEQTLAGQVDILIGTHRLLSADVGFRNLGLVVIDEEQRFGVAHKERLKRWRAEVDVLTLTATPIPRTLHMALLGLRDITTLATPPVDRMSVETRVEPASEARLRSVIERELARGGQVFLLHNRIRSLESRADDVKRLVPGARVVTAHGKMDAGDIEKAMLDILRGEADVLVCTSLISNGVDIPNVNTIAIDNAHRFGLAELHQLRGRVGRSDRKGHAILFLPAHGGITQDARRRLHAMEEYADLGAGFQISMRDLEIRGAGNILGPQQSGHIVAVGYELYCRMLEDTVRRLRGEGPSRRGLVSFDVNLAAYIPESYTGSHREKISLLRRLLPAPDHEALSSIEEEMKDRFGKIPPEAAAFLDVLHLKLHLGDLGVRSVSLTHDGLILRGGSLRLLEESLQGYPGRVFRLGDDVCLTLWKGDGGSAQVRALLGCFRSKAATRLPGRLSPP
ncbi:MAG: transcription-repair coupling factor [Planctomycetota bacterium]